MTRYRGYKKSVPSVEKPQIFTFAPIKDEMKMFQRLVEGTPFTARELKHLFDILKTRRPHSESFTEETVKALVDPYLPEGFTIDQVGNRIVKIGESETLFSCHVDTVHWDPGLQNIAFNLDSRIIYKTDGECLGADDGTGIWIMLMMIRNQIPGTYIFHVGEEVGGVGSKHIVQASSDLLLGVRRAIAFDRKGTTDIIDRQRGQQCCSKEFVNALAEQLNVDAPSKWRGTSGSFTDTANYMAWVPECTNLSVGYESQHTGNESQDVGALLCMMERFLQVDWEALPTVRDPFAKPKAKKSGAARGRHPSLTGGWDAWGEWYDSRDSQPEKPKKPSGDTTPAADDVFINALDASKRFLTLAEIKKLIHRYPEVAAHILYTAAIDFRDVEDALGPNQGYKQRVIEGLTKGL